MELWIPINANMEKIETRINEWMQVTKEYPYVHKIQDRINSMYPTIGTTFKLYVVEIKNNCIHLPYENMPKEFCSICIEHDREYFETLKCGHKFHPKCISAWLKRNNSCPYCRTIIRYTLLLLL